VYYLLLDLAELANVDQEIRWFSHNRPNLLSFRDSDHMARSGEMLDVAIARRLHAKGIERSSVRVELLTNARVMGYVFNPVSFYFVRDVSTDALQLVIAEVHNTHGEEEVYELERIGEDTVYRSSVEKRLYVSPFIDMAAVYQFECRELGDRRMDLRIDEYDLAGSAATSLFFQAQVQVRPLPLTNANVARMLFRYPFMTLQTIGLIHWQGFKLWLRGLRYRKHVSKGRTAA
jgi:DUF1365 family protein